MIEEQDVEIFLKAKKEAFFGRALQMVSACLLCALIFLEVVYPEHDYPIVLATLSVVLMAAALGHSKWVIISRARLIQTLESIFNRDANALRLLAEKRNKQFTK